MGELSRQKAVGTEAVPEVALVTLVQLHVTQVVPPQVARHGAPAKAHYRALRAGKIWCISTVTFHMIFQVLHFTEANIASLPFTTVKKRKERIKI